MIRCFIFSDYRFPHNQRELSANPDDEEKLAEYRHGNLLKGDKRNAMKKIIGVLMISAGLFACNNQESTTNEAVGEDVDPYRQVGVENVNGNIPDTTDAIDLSTQKDSTVVADTVSP